MAISINDYADRAKPYAHALDQACVAKGYSQLQAYVQIAAESAWDPSAASSAGAIGLCQIMPATAQGWGMDPNDPLASIDALVEHMNDYQKTFTGKYPKNTPFELALAAYNAGESAVEEWHGIPPYAETEHYVTEITEACNKALEDGSWQALWSKLLA
jgi:soluble lytic murein transglycosylase-like protein